MGKLQLLRPRLGRFVLAVSGIASTTGCQQRTEEPQLAPQFTAGDLDASTSISDAVPSRATEEAEH